MLSIMINCTTMTILNSKNLNKNKNIKYDKSIKQAKRDL